MAKLRFRKSRIAVHIEEMIKLRSEGSKGSISRLVQGAAPAFPCKMSVSP